MTGETVYPAGVSVALHVDPSQVKATDLRPDGDLVTVMFGDNHANVSLTGTRDHVAAVLAEAIRKLADL